MTTIYQFPYFKAMHKDTQQALHIIKTNLDFFCAPFLNQKEFQHWTLSSGQEQNIRNLTDSLIIPLTNPTSYIAEFIDALIGKSLEPKDTSCLRCGEEQRLIDLLEKNWSLRRSILMVGNNPAIQKWNHDHPQLINKTKKFFTIYEAVNAIEEKIKKLDPQFKEDVEYSLTSLSSIKQELYHFINAQNKYEEADFQRQCFKLIQQAKQDLRKRWGGNREFNPILFLIYEVSHSVFSTGNPYSFFNDHSSIMNSLRQLETTVALL